MTTRGNRVVALDTETALIRPGVLAPPLTCVSTYAVSGHPAGDLLYCYTSGHKDVPQGDEIRNACAPILELDLIVGHNVAFDMAVLGCEFPDLLPYIFKAYDEDRITDTMIRQRLIDIAYGCLGGEFVKGRFVKYGYSLADLYARHGLGELPKPAVRQQYGELRNVPIGAWSDEAVRYAKDDAIATWKIWHNQKALSPELLQDQYRQARAAFALHLASCWGLVTDAAAIERLEGETRKAYDRARRILQKVGFVRANGTRDTKAAKAYMLKACAKSGIEPKRTDTYQKAADPDEITEKTAKDPLWGVSLDEDACIQSGSHILKKYAELSSLMTVVESHIPALKNGLIAPIQPRFNVLVDTGRTSCLGHDSDNPNPSSYGYQVQNIRRLPGIRECFVPRPGNVFIASDYAALELHTWAQVCLWAVETSALADALNQGVDPHIVLACELTGDDYAALQAKIKAGDHDAKEARQFAKIGNFGFMGGMGATTFRKWARVAYGVSFDEDFAVNLRETWMRTWPESKLYFQWISNQIDRSDDPNGAHVEHFMSGRHRGPIGFTVCANTYFQGLGADAAKAALWAVTRECWLGKMAGARVVNFVHDEIVTECPEEVAAEYAEIQGRIMVEEAHKWLPDVKPKVESVLTRRLSKEAKPLHDEHGRLIPWDWKAK